MFARPIAVAALLLTASLGATRGASAQFVNAHNDPWAPTELFNIKPVAPLDGGLWMKGDLHVHSEHSKESSNNSEAKIIHFAEAKGFDYLCISDHDNHVLGDTAHNTWSDPSFHSDKVQLLYCAEWTTTRGHGNMISATPYDHQRMYDVRDQRDDVVAAVKRELGIHLSANHPSGKDHFGYSYDMVDSIEVWNSVLFSKNANAIMIWDDMLSSGRRLTGRGGSDTHHGRPERPELASKNSYQAEVNYIGTPTTWVYATSRSKQAVVDALNNGRVAVSANPYAPRVEFYADTNSDGKMDMMMGDNVKATGQPVHFQVKLTGKTVPDATYKVHIVKDGNPWKDMETDGKKAMVEFTDAPIKIGRTFYRVEVSGPATDDPEVPGAKAIEEKDGMVGLSNPIYFNFNPTF